MTAFVKEEWRSCVYTQQFISQSRSTLLRDNEKRLVENTERVSYRSFDFSFFFFKFLSFLYPPFNATARSVFEASDPRESGAAKQVTRKFCDVPETFDESARHSNFLLFSKLFSLSLEPSKMYSSNVVLASLSPRDLETRWR